MRAVLVDLPGGEHAEVRIYVGPDEEHRAYAGTLRMRIHEAQDFCMRINFTSTSNTHATGNAYDVKWSGGDSDTWRDQAPGAGNHV